MPPRIPLRPRALRLRAPHPSPCAPLSATYGTLVNATTPAPPIDQTIRSVPPVLRYPPTQPPSHKQPQIRKTQLHRQYQSILKSSPLILLFQHNNIKAVELMAIRRELAIALHKVDSERVKNGGQEDLYADQIRFQIIQTGIFASALRVVEFFNPKDSTMDYAQHPTDPATPTSAQIPNTTNSPDDKRFTHGLSRRAWEAASNRKLTTELDPLLSGPLAIVAFPSVSPQYLKTVISILAPSKEFPAPKRKVNPDYHEPAVQYGLQKLMLLGARVEGRVFDADGTKWVGGIDGGIDGLRAQLVHALEGIGGSLAGALEGAGRSLWVTVESRRMDMEEKEGSGKEKKKEE